MMTLEEFMKLPIKVPTEVVLPVDLKPLFQEICDNHIVSPRHLIGGIRQKNVVAARRELIERMHFELRYQVSEIAAILEMDVTSVKHYLGLRTASKVKYGLLKSLYRSDRFGG